MRTTFPSIIRIVFLTLIALLFFGASFLFGFFKGLGLDELIIIGLFNLIFVCIFIVVINSKRLSGSLYKGTNYLFLFIVYLICFGLCYAQSKVPEYYIPVGILPLLLSAALPGTLSIGSGLYFYLISSVCFGQRTYTLYSYIAILVIAVLLGEYLKAKEGKFRVISGIIFGLICLMFPMLFSYLLTYSVEQREILIYLGLGIVNAIFMIFLYNPICKLFKRQRRNGYETIIDGSHPILVDLKKLSAPEFNHSVRVANLSGECADKIGADRLLAMAGGLYYHASNIYSVDDREKFYKRLNNLCFPPEVITLISHNGEDKNMPTSREGAIVHMVDALVTKFDALRDHAEGQWNTNMVVYQTLNDYSTQGYYDGTGLSMNEFLVIRDFLANKNFSVRG